MRCAVGIVLEALDETGHTVLVTLEVDHTITLLVATTAMAGGDAAFAIASTRLAFTGNEWRVRRTFVQPFALDLDNVSAPW